jgi:putative ABC transport system permease protein
VILTRALLAMAVVMATVGTLGLASTMGVSVVERTREFAVMKTVGATPRRIIVLLIAEALFIGALSWIIALILAVPLTGLVDTLVGRLGFVAPLPFIISPSAAFGWLALLGGVSLVSTILPANRAAHMSVAKALVSL